MDHQGANSKPKSGLSGNVLRQWVDKVTGFSSQYDDSRWSADRIIGYPAVYPRYGDEPGSWASGDVDDRQYIEIQFREAVYIQEINIYETYNAGGVKRVLARAPNHQWEPIYETDEVIQWNTSRIFSPPLKPVNYRCANLRIEIDCTVSESWVELDAVELVGKTMNLPELTPINDLSNDLSSMVNNKDYSDVTFSVNGQQYHAHRVILAARSGYFKTLFSSGAKDGSKKPVEMKDTTNHGFNALLHFLYTSQIPPDYSGRQLVDIVRAADHFICEGMKLLAINILCEGLTNDNVVDVYCAANTQPVIDEIKTCCLEYINRNMGSVVKTPDFEQLPKDVMLDIIQQTNALSI